MPTQTETDSFESLSSSPKRCDWNNCMKERNSGKMNTSCECQDKPRQTVSKFSLHRQHAVIDTTVWKRKSSYANLSKVTKRCWELYLYLGAANYQFVSYISRDQETQPSKKSGSLASALYSMMWFYQLSWQCKWAILESFWSWCFECELWRRANARNVRFTNSSSWPIYFFNSVDETKFSCISFTYVWSTTVSLETYHSFIHKVWLG